MQVNKYKVHPQTRYILHNHARPSSFSFLFRVFSHLPHLPLPPLSVSFLCHLSFTPYDTYYITPTTRHCHANIPSSTGHKNNIAKPKTDKWLTSPSFFSFLFFVLSPFNYCLIVVLKLDYPDLFGLPRKFACSVLS